MSYAQVVRRASGKSPPGLAPQRSLGVERARCLILHTPSPPPKIESVAIALQKAFPDIAPKLQLFVDSGRVLVQHEESIDPTILLTKGLMLNKIQSKFSSLHNVSKQDHLIELNLKGIDHNSSSFEQLKAVLSDYGKPIEITFGTWPGTSVKNGEANVLLDTTNAAVKSLPRTFDIDVGDALIKIQYKSVGVMRHCYRCRGTDHVRATCPTAPPCAKCHSRSHPEWFCKERTAARAPAQQAAKSVKPLSIESIKCIQEALEVSEPEWDSIADENLVAPDPSATPDSRIGTAKANINQFLIARNLPSTTDQRDANGDVDMGEINDYAGHSNLTFEAARQLYNAVLDLQQTVLQYPMAEVEKAIGSSKAFWGFVKAKNLLGEPSIQTHSNNAASASNLTNPGAGSASSVN